jgi:uncharacterized RDD family membrane protein YckC
VHYPPHPQAGDAPEKAPIHPGSSLPLASLRLRLMSLVYEGILLFAVLFVSSYLFLSLARDAQSGLPRALFQIYLLSVCGVYFVFCWTRTGQTLPMKTWRIRVVTEDGRALSVAGALRRYVLAIPGMLSGISLLWAPFDRERQFLHDRLARTRIVRVELQDSGRRTRDSGLRKSDHH